jgi:hypothetical protein
MSVDIAIKSIEDFQGTSLTKSLAGIERAISGFDSATSQAFCGEQNIDTDFISSALSIKKVAGQINVILHAAGILHTLPQILEEGEKVESVSLGAGNTGKKFDLETNLRIAEFKFITWQGGSESIRQNGVFKDFFELAEYETDKKKVLYVVDTYRPLKFFTGGRALTSVLSQRPEVLIAINSKYGKAVKVVRDYYALHKDKVDICDIGQYLGE